jgi:hypothetical protein
MSDPYECFVIMPFAQAHRKTYDRAIKPAVALAADGCKAALRCRRADDELGSSSILKEIVQSIHRARVIIADLTDNNPNVFYELGIAHTAGYKTIMLSRQENKLPFDLQAYKVIYYDEDKLSELRIKLAQAIADLVMGRYQASNPVQDHAPIRYCELILSKDEIIESERKVEKTVWVVQPTFDTDMKYLVGPIRDNLTKKRIENRYILPESTNSTRTWDQFQQKLKLNKKAKERLEVRLVKEHEMESEIVINDAKEKTEKIYSVSPVELPDPFVVLIAGAKKIAIRNRFEYLWEIGTSVNAID